MTDTAARLAISAWRNDDVFELPMQLRGIDATNLAFAMQIRLAADTPGPALIDLGKVTNGNAQGIRVAGVSAVSGVPTSDVRIRINKSTMQALPYAGELGESARLEYALLIGGTTRIVGTFEVLAHAYGSDAAPANRVPGFAGARVGSGTAGASFQFGDTVVQVSIVGVEQVNAQVQLAAEQVQKAAGQAALATAERVRAGERATVAQQGAASAAESATSAQSRATDAAAILDAVRGEIAGLPTDAQLSLKASSLATMAGLPTSASPTPVILTERGKDGIWIQRSKSDDPSLAGKVAADGLKILFDQSTMDADKVWVRSARWGVLPEWAGAKGNNTDSDAKAFNRILDLLKYLSTVNIGPQYGNGRGAPKLFIPSAAYYLASATLELQYTAWLKGETTGGFAGISTVLRWDDGVTGIRTQWYNSAGASGGPVGNTGHVGSAGSIIENLHLRGGYAGAESESHGVQLRAKAQLRDLLISNFGGDGLFIQASSGSNEYNGNCNGSMLTNIGAINNRNGVYVEGIDTNAIVWNNVVTNSNRRYGKWIKDNLANVVVGGDDSTNGSDYAYPSKCRYNGRWYYCLPRQEAWAASNPPSGTTAANQGWAYLPGPGTAAGEFPAWQAGMAVRAAGSMRIEGVGTSPMLFGVYTEGDQPPILCEGKSVLISDAINILDFAGNAYGGWIRGDAGGILLPGGMTVRGVPFFRGRDFYLGQRDDDPIGSDTTLHRITNNPAGALITSFEVQGAQMARDFYDAGSKSMWSQVADPAGKHNFISGSTYGLVVSSAGLQPFTTTTAQAPNLYQSSSGDLMLRSTSSKRYKRRIEDVDPAYADRILDLRPVWYRSKAEADDPAHGYWGLIAEEVAKIDPRLVHFAFQEDQLEQVEVVPAREAIEAIWNDVEVVERRAKEAVFDKDGNEVSPAVPATYRTERVLVQEASPATDAIYDTRPKEHEEPRPDGVQYERVSVLELAVLQRHEKTILTQAATIASLEERLAALEARIA